MALSMLLSCLTLFVVQPNLQDLQAKIMFSEPASRLEVLIPKLSEESGAKLKVSAEVKHDVMLIHVRQRLLKEVLDTIANQCLADWVEEKDGSLVLTRSKAKLSAQREDEKRQRVETFRKMQADLKDQLAKRGPFDLQKSMQQIREFYSVDNALALPNGYEKWQELSSAFPVQDAIARIASEIDPELLTSVYEDGRIVFAEKPTKMQRKLPAKFAGYLQHAERDLVSLSESVRDAGFSESTYSSLINFANNAILRKGNISGTYASPWYFSVRTVYRGLGFFLERVDGPGRLSTYIDVPVVLPSGPLLPAAPETPIRLSEGVATFASELRKASQTSNPTVGAIYYQDPKDLNVRYKIPSYYQTALPYIPRLTEAHQSWLSNPERHEPLGLWVSEALVASANAMQSDMIAWLTDDLLPPTLQKLTSGNVTCRQFLEDKTLWVKMRFQKKEDLITLSPMRTAAQLGLRGARKEFGDLLRLLSKDRWASVADLSKWAGHQARSPWQGYDELYLNVVHPLFMSRMGIISDWSRYRLLGLLSDGQRETLLDGGRVSVAALPDSAKENAKNWLFLTGNSLGYFDQDGKRSGPFVYRTLGEITTVFGDGIPANAFLEMRMAIEPAALVEYGDGWLTERCTATEFAGIELSRAQAVFTNSATLPNATGYQPGQARQMQLWLHPTPGNFKVKEFTDFRVTGRRTSKFDDLPAELRADVAKLIAIVTKAPGG